ncbi:MAG: carboxypeptidase-like regulatory domain-containing protein, partial [Chitinophagaceae bacterium]|nr:carboxypeptidase-like regulatory domain-containing protein [Chitinophagaceae bacterium]
MIIQWLRQLNCRRGNYSVKAIILIFFFLIALRGAAQLKVNGKVVDSENNEPVRGATVYADQTQLTAVSDAQGFFRLNGISPKAVIIVTHTGYEKARVYLENAGDTLVVRLIRKDVSLDNVVLDLKTKNNWERWGSRFTTILIGENMGKECLLQNPQDVRFEYDKNKMILKARARNPLLVENRMLGYVVHIDLDSLVYSFEQGTMLYVMSAYFELTEEKDEVMKKMIAANRLRAFRGSRMHFARALYNKKLEEEGFHLYQYKGTLNAEKGRVERLLLKTLAESNDPYLKETGNKIDLTVFGRDSARYYKKVLEQPGYFFQDSLPVHFDTRWKEGNASALFYMGSDSLLLAYKEAKGKALPDNALKKWARMKEPGSSLHSDYDFLKAGNGQTKYTLLYLLSGSRIAIRQNGYVEENRSLFMEGYLAGNRLAYDLPWDYDPAADEQQLLEVQQDFVSDGSRTIENSWQRIANGHSTAELYLHLDKTIYDPGENIWFAAYMVRSPFKPEDHHTLYVMLQNPETKQVMASEKFVMQSGLGAGYVFLPDSFPPGIYHLVAYTNTLPLEKNPVLFDQAIVLRPVIHPFSIQYEAAANMYQNDSVSIVCKVKNEAGQPAADMEISYRLTATGEPLAIGKERTNKKGELIVKAVPLKKAAGRKLVLQTDIRQKSETWQLRNELTLPGNYLRIRWYPEGGELVDGIPARLAYEVKDLYNQPVGVKLNLLKDKQIVGTLNTDSSGAGTIELTARHGELYSLALLTDSLVITENNFPEIQKQGYTIYAERGVVDDSLRLFIRSTKDDAALYMMIHDYKKQYYFDKVAVKGKEKSMSFPAAMLPEGLCTITLFDEAAKPVAERSVFKEPFSRPELKIELDSAVYHNRSKVQVKLKAKDGEGNPLRAVVSLACVLNSRIDTTRFQDIVPFSYLNNYKVAGVYGTKPDYFQYRKNRLERFLLIQCWTRYKWQLTDSLSNSNKAAHYSMTQRGQVFYKGAKPEHPVEVILVTPSNLLTFATDSSGYFELDKTMLTTEPDWRLTLAVSAKHQSDYTILLVNDNDELQQQLAA